MALNGIAAGIANTLVRVVGGGFGVQVSPIATAAHNLRKGGNVVSSLVIAEPFSGASGTLRLALPDGGGGLTGTVPAGLMLTIGSYAYTVTADAQAEDDALALDVTLNPLGDQDPPAPSGAGTSVTVAAKVDFALPISGVDGASSMDTSALQERAGCELLVPKTGAPAYFRPRKNMLISGAPNGPHILVSELLESPGHWSLLLGRA